MQPFDPFQLSYSGTHLIEASAGTGKTYSIASLYVRAIVDENKTVDEILVVTYTEAATKELRDRLLSRLRESIHILRGDETSEDAFLEALFNYVDDKAAAIRKLQQAIHSFDEAAVLTIHGFCRQVLQNQAFESKALFDMELVGDDSELVGEMILDYWRRWVREATDDPQKRPLLKLLMDKKINPDSLTEKLAKHVGKPYLDVYPRELPLNKFYDSISKLQELFEQLQNIWSDYKEDITTLLMSDKMNGRSYKPASIPDWASEMDIWLQSKVVPLTWFEKFEKFGQSVINESTVKAAADDPPQHPFFAAVDIYINRAGDVQRFDVAFSRHLFAALCNQLGDKKEELKVYSFDDLLTKLQRALADSPLLSNVLRDNYPVALVDEFQDTDPIQYQIFSAIYNSDDTESVLFMIGDPKQSVYSFRGADIFTYLQAKNNVSGEHMYGLEKNFRSVPPLIKAVNKLFSFRENPFMLNKIPFNDVVPGREKYGALKIDEHSALPIQINRLGHSDDDFPINKGEADKRSAADTATRILGLLKKAEDGKATIEAKKLEASDIAVLVRKHKQADLIRDALQERGIKSVQYSRENVFQSAEARELQQVLKALAEPANEGLVRAALITQFIGYTSRDLITFEEDQQQWVQKLNRFEEANREWQQNGVAAALWMIMHQEKIQQQVIKLPNGERKLTNYIHLTELLQQQEKEGKTGSRSLRKWLANKRENFDKNKEEEQLKLESDESLVKIVTMHRSKGLEYPVVFCPFLWRGPELVDKGNPLVYHPKNGDITTTRLDFNGKKDPKRSQKYLNVAGEELAESIRLAYVALTRAQYQCHISWVHSKKTEFSAFGYLLLGYQRCKALLKQKITGEGYNEKVQTAEFDEAIKNLQDHASQLIEVSIQKKYSDEKLTLNDGYKGSLKAQRYKRHTALEAGYGVGSFSSLSRQEHEDAESEFELYYDEPLKGDEPEPQNGGQTIFSFPKGPHAGTAVHHCFENVDFNDSSAWNDVIKEQLGRQSIPERWVPVARNMLRRTIQKPLLLDKPNLRLNAISTEHQRAEMEFYFPSDNLELNELLNIIRPGFSTNAAAKGFVPKGFLKGYIDLTFKCGNRFYILDYKTNHLGHTIQDYRTERLEEEMQQAYYDVQSHVYCAALHRFLRQRMPNYSYETHFGGAFYLFVRGINEKGPEGIYFDRPDEALIQKLNSYLARSPQ
jgi:exodeoxyribonuclease V beta subunit